MEYIEYSLKIFSGLIVVIPLVLKLIEYVQKAVKERNWNKMLELVMGYMVVAEEKFSTGVERKEWVLAMMKASADTINYDLDMEAISDLIDNLCSMTKKVNPPTDNKTATKSVSSPK